MTQYQIALSTERDRGLAHQVLEYVLITPARNEAAFIAKTIQSVITQTVLPKRWIVVSDASTDGTDDIVKRFMADHPWIELIHLNEQQDRSFSAKARVFNAGYERVRSLSFELVGNVDADVSFANDYFAYLLRQFEMKPNLGVAGTDYVEGAFHSFGDSYMDTNHVNGGCQLFRRSCFEAIGGYAPVRGGGIDWVAVTTARMRGWATRSYHGRIFTHHRPIGTADRNVLMSRLMYGRKDYLLGGHPLWQIARSFFQMTKKPYLLGGLFLLLGYASCAISRTERSISPELVAFHRKEQLDRLRQFLVQFGSRSLVRR